MGGEIGVKKQERKVREKECKRRNRERRRLEDGQPAVATTPHRPLSYPNAREKKTITSLPTARHFSARCPPGTSIYPPSFSSSITAHLSRRLLPLLPRTGAKKQPRRVSHPTTLFSPSTSHGRCDSRPPATNLGTRKALSSPRRAARSTNEAAFRPLAHSLVGLASGLTSAGLCCWAAIPGREEDDVIAREPS